MRVETSCAGVDGRTGHGSFERVDEEAKVRSEVLEIFRDRKSLLEVMADMIYFEVDAGGSTSKPEVRLYRNRVNPLESALELRTCRVWKNGRSVDLLGRLQAFALLQCLFHLFFVVSLVTPLSFSLPLCCGLL